MTENTQLAIENLNKRGFKAVFFENPDDALAHIVSETGSDDIGMGGSMTLTDLGWYSALSNRGNVHWHAKTPEDKGTMARANASPCYILSANAIAQNGELVNIDANGNRISATSFGQKKVFYVCGENKIVPTLENAIWRAKNIAAPLNAKRLNRKTPCAIKADKCYKCNSPERICRTCAITSRPPSGMDVHVIILSGSWGY